MQKFIIGTVAAAVTFAVGAEVTGLHKQKRRIDQKLQRNELAHAIYSLKEKVKAGITS